MTNVLSLPVAGPFNAATFIILRERLGYRERAIVDPDGVVLGWQTDRPDRAASTFDFEVDRALTLWAFNAPREYQPTRRKEIISYLIATDRVERMEALNEASSIHPAVAGAI